MIVPPFKSVIFAGVLIAFAYALDKETLKRLNWNSIKVSLLTTTCTHHTEVVIFLLISIASLIG